MTTRKPASLSKAARNERRKLFANSVKAVGLGIFAVGFIQPAITLSFGLSKLATMALSAFASYIFHAIARRVLRDLED